MERVKITVAIEEPFEYGVGSNETRVTQTRYRDTTMYEQTVELTGEPDNNYRGLIADIAAIVNNPKGKS